MCQQELAESELDDLSEELEAEGRKFNESVALVKLHLQQAEDILNANLSRLIVQVRTAHHHVAACSVLVLITVRVRFRRSIRRPTTSSQTCRSSSTDSYSQCESTLVSYAFLGKQASRLLCVLQMRNDIAKCEPLYVIFDTQIEAVCDKVLNPFVSPTLTC